MTTVILEVYRRRGQEMAGAMRLCREDSAYTAATALLAIHSASAYNDAIQVKLTGRLRRNSDHKWAVLEARRACLRAGLSDRGLRHLQKLVGFKTDVSYGDKNVEAQLRQELSIDAERFESWALGLLKA
jgi:hypothetical protein